LLEHAPTTFVETVRSYALQNCDVWFLAQWQQPAAASIPEVNSVVEKKQRNEHKTNIERRVTLPWRELLVWHKYAQE
jgi:hypothetical protein